MPQPVPVPKQLSQITILRTGYPDSRKIIFPHQSQQQSGVLTVGLLLADSLGLNLRRIADPYLATQFYQQPLEPPSPPPPPHPPPHPPLPLPPPPTHLPR